MARRHRHHGISLLFQHQFGGFSDVLACSQRVRGGDEADVIVVNIILLGYPPHDIGYVDIVAS